MRVCEGVAISLVMSALSQSSPEVGEDKAWAVASGRGIWRGGGRGDSKGALLLSRCRGVSPIVA